MKKYFLMILCIAVLFVVAGCSKKNQVVCTEEQTEGGITIKGEVVVDFDKDDKLTDATASYDLGSKETADQYCQIFKMMEDADKGIAVECSGSKVIIKGFAKVQEDDEEQMIGMSKEDFLKKSEEENMNCK